MRILKILGLMVVGAVVLTVGTALADNYGLTEVGVGKFLPLLGGDVAGDIVMTTGDIKLDDGVTVSKLYLDDDFNTYYSASADNRHSFWLSSSLLYQLYTTRFELTADVHQLGAGNYVKNLSASWFIDDSIRFGTATIAADDVTPSVGSTAGSFVHTTSANTVPTAITDLDDVTAGEIYILCGGSATNASTVGDSGNFNLTAAITLTTDTCIGLFVQADNDYLELFRAVN